jgi:hypothetical protein
MLHLSLLRTLAVVGVTVGVAFIDTASIRAAAPTAPTNLTYSVNGQMVTLTWTAAANAPTNYILQAGFASGQTAAAFSVGPSTTVTAPAGPGTYFVRIVAINADGTSPPSNEVVVVVSCAPSVPQNFRVIQKGTEAFLFWAPPSTGVPTGYGIQAGLGPNQTMASFATPNTSMNATAGSGTYFVRLFAMSGCGNSPATSDVVVSFPNNSGRVADPSPGTFLGMPDVEMLVQRFAAGDRPTRQNTCPTDRKYDPSPWQDRLIAFLRTYDTRFGYNSKPTRTAVDNNGFPVIAAADEITFFAGSGPMEGSSDVYTFDVLISTCGDGDPVIGWRNIAPEPARWTGAGRFTGDEQ